jgi:hypothetical protein
MAEADGEPGAALATSTTSPNLPSLDEAHRVVTFVLDDQARAVAGKVAEGAPTDDSLREIIALTIAVVGATEHLYRMIGPTYPDQWESMERSSRAFTDHHVIGFLAENDPAWKRALTKHRRRKFSARAGALCLVESQLGQRARWSKVTLPDNAPIPISVAVSEGLGELAYEVEQRLHEHLGSVESPDPLVLAGQVVGLLSASECLLALFPSNKVAAFCVRLAAMSEDAAAQWP